MTQFVIANNVNTTLAAALPSSGAGSTTITLASSANLPTLTSGQVMPLTLNDAATRTIFEIVYVTAISGVTLTVERGQEGTGALNWSIGDAAYCAPTAGTTEITTGNPNLTFMVSAALAANQAPRFSQVTGIVGDSRNAQASLASASASMTWTADRLLVEDTTNNLRYLLSSLNLTVNLGTTGAGGLDTGTAPTSSEVLPVYVIYNPTTGTSALLAQNQDTVTTKATETYTGAYMPAGYTASALIGVFIVGQTSGQFSPFVLSGRRYSFANDLVFSSTAAQTLTAEPLNLGNNVKSISGFISMQVSSGGGGSVNLCGNSGSVGTVKMDVGNTAGTVSPYQDVVLASPQTLYVLIISTASSLAVGIYVTALTF